MKKINFWPFGEHRRVTSVVGEREFMYKGELVKDFHKGWDIGLPEGSGFRSPEAAKTIAGWDKAFGDYLVLHGQIYRWNFWHLSKIRFLSGASVDKGILLGGTGNSGMSTAPHCHMQIAFANLDTSTYIDPFEVFTDEILETLEFPNNPEELKRVKQRKFYEGVEWARQEHLVPVSKSGDLFSEDIDKVIDMIKRVRSRALDGFYDKGEIK
jgi:murein DD-endopeptidase MepM/ murein hydrolase activator NlpD